MRPTLSTEGNLLYSVSMDFNFYLIWKITTETSRIMFGQISGYHGPARLTHKMYYCKYHRRHVRQLRAWMGVEKVKASQMVSWVPAPASATCSLAASRWALTATTWAALASMWHSQCWGPKAARRWLHELWTLCLPLTRFENAKIML